MHHTPYSLFFIALLIRNLFVLVFLEVFVLRLAFVIITIVLAPIRLKPQRLSAVRPSCPQRFTFLDAIWSERDIGLWVSFGRILNQPQVASMLAMSVTKLRKLWSG
jgi:hypothetical protein